MTQTVDHIPVARTSARVLLAQAPFRSTATCSLQTRIRFVYSARLNGHPAELLPGARTAQCLDTPRGLVVTMAEILFATRKYDLAPGARESLAKLSGILLAHPGLKLAIEGHTDSTGSEDFNMKLSGQRADTVRQYLIQQDLNPDSITAQGLGMANPVAGNATTEGRKQNRRVKIIVSGEAIGTRIG